MFGYTAYGHSLDEVILAGTEILIKTLADPWTVMARNWPFFRCSGHLGGYSSGMVECSGIYEGRQRDGVFTCHFVRQRGFRQTGLAGGWS